MLEVDIVQGRRISGVEIAEITGLIEANPKWCRTQLSRFLAERWQWYAASGQLKDMAARSLLLKLHERGLIVLPQRRQEPRLRRPPLPPELFDSALPDPIVVDLSALLPLSIAVADPKLPDYRQFQRYLAQHHYLSFNRNVGESMGYLIKSCAGVDLACVLFGAAAWQCAPRDQWIGWSSEQRAQGLPRIVNNSRFLIMPWVRVSCLASHILAQIARRINADWQARYRHPIDLLETFVQQDRFRGTCYQAANWIHVGQTTGRTRQSKRHRDNQVHAPVKDVYLYPVHADARRQLCR